MIKDNERLDDLQVGNLHIIQDPSSYCFTSDAVLLANFVSNVVGKNVVELCCGSGVIATLVAFKCRPSKVVGVEIQPSLYDMARRSVELNMMSEQIELHNIDLKGCAKVLGYESADAVVCNPPYRKVDSGARQTNNVKEICRHEILATLDDVILSSSQLLKTNGSLYLVHQADRLAEIIYTMKKYNIEAKQLTCVCSRVGVEANLVLIRGVKGGKVGLTINSNIVMFDENNNYTQTIAQLYSDEKR